MFFKPAHYPSPRGLKFSATILPMQADPIAELRRLTEHYRELSDDELRNLAADFADLTETAQQALRTEMQSRGLRLAAHDPFADPLHATNAPVASNAPLAHPPQQSPPATITKPARPFKIKPAAPAVSSRASPNSFLTHPTTAPNSTVQSTTPGRRRSATATLRSKRASSPKR